MSQGNKGFGTCATVQIASEDAPGGFVVINKEDFNEEIHELYVEGKASAEKPLDKMNKTELLVVAEKNGVELDSNETKADIVAKIIAKIQTVVDPE